MSTTVEHSDAEAATADQGCAEGCVWVHRHYPDCPIWVTTCMICKRINVEDLTEQAEKLRLEVHPEAHCHRCGGPNIPWSAPSPLWNQVMRGGDINGGPEPHNGIVCPTCFAVMAQELGIARLWRLSAQRVDVPLQTVTPSGRVWNEQTWKFDEPKAPAEL